MRKLTFWNIISVILKKVSMALRAAKKTGEGEAISVTTDILSKEVYFLLTFLIWGFRIIIVGID